MNSLAFIARRALRPADNATVNLRCYCPPPSSSSLAPNSKLFVAGLSLSLSVIFHFIYTKRDCNKGGFLDFEGLSWSVDEMSLKDAFSSFGEVTEGKYVTPLTPRHRYIYI